MEDKALLQILVDMLAYYKHQARMLVWVVVIVLAMHLATVIGFLYYESQWETQPTTTTTTQTVDEYDNVTSTALITVPKGCCFACSVRYVDATTDDAATTPTPLIEVQNANLVINRVA